MAYQLNALTPEHTKETKVMDEATKAEQTLATLEAKRAAAEARAVEIAEARKALGFRVHADGDAKARAKLDKLNAESATLAGEIESLDGAIAEATTRVRQAQAAEAQVQARETARKLLKMADAVVGYAQSLDDANAIRVEASRALADELMQMRSLAQELGMFVPSHEQLFAMGSRADQTATMQTPWAREIGEHLPPNQRRDHMSYAQSWHVAITKAVAALVGEDKQEAA
jgi:hypothetical protein